MSRILIVEDERMIAMDLAFTVMDLGHEVVGSALSGEIAIKVADAAIKSGRRTEEYRRIGQ